MVAVAAMMGLAAAVLRGMAAGAAQRAGASGGAAPAPALSCWLTRSRRHWVGGGRGTGTQHPMREATAGTVQSACRLPASLLLSAFTCIIVLLLFLAFSCCLAAATAARTLLLRQCQSCLASAPAARPGPRPRWPHTCGGCLGCSCGRWRATRRGAARQPTVCGGWGWLRGSATTRAASQPPPCRTRWVACMPCGRLGQACV